MRISPACFKLRYKSELEARLTIAGFIWADTRLVLERYIYDCPQCHYFHLTKRPVWNGRQNLRGI